MTDTKTHYRKAFDSPYLSSGDIVDSTVLTIKFVRLEKDRTKKTQDEFNTAHFVEQELRPGEKLKPMILNAGNSKILKGLAGSPFIDDWNNIRIIVYVDQNVRFGKETVEGLRISPHRAELPAQCPPELLAAARAAADKGRDVFGAWWKACAPGDRGLLGSGLDDLKARTEAADKARTVDNKPPAPPVKPATVADAANTETGEVDPEFLAAMDRAESALTGGGK